MVDFVIAFFYGAIIEAFIKYRLIKWIYIGFVIAVFFTSGSHNVLSVFFATIIVVGIYHYVLYIPYRAKIKAWEKLFEKMKLDKSDGMPFFLYEKEISKNAYVSAFKTTIPLSVWNSKKEVMEMILNKKILSIVQDEENNQIVKLTTCKKAIPTKVNWQERYTSKASTKLKIGMGYLGIVHMDLEMHPHTFIAGETGSGKSNILKCMIHQALAKNYNVILIDFKRGVSFSEFGESMQIYYDYLPTAKILDDMVAETVKRLDLFRTSKVDNIGDYNKRSSDKLKRKIIFIDELAELLKTRDKTLSNRLYDSIETLTRLSRAVGIHLIMGIQRPDSTIISGQIKNNVPFRICGRFVDREPSRIMLGCDDASHLPNIKGRFIVKDNDMHEVQSFYYSSENSNQFKPTRQVKGLGIDDIEDTSTYDEEAPIKEEPLTLPKRKTAVDGLEFDFSDVKKIME